MAAAEPFAVYLGYDDREAACTDVAAHSIARRTSAQLNIYQLNHWKLREQGIFNRPWLTGGMGGSNQIIDVLDGKTFSTQFSHTRFLVPHLMNYQGWALFLDADMVCLSDVKDLFALCDDKYAVMCVKHNYPPRKDTIKMDGRAQRFYRRKNWSSFVLWNCGHPANKIVTPEYVNFKHGADLHAFAWLPDTLIGDLPPVYNYISGISPRPTAPSMPAFIHFSDGGPWFRECQDVPYAGTWVEEWEDWQRKGDGNKYTEIPTTRVEI